MRLLGWTAASVAMVIGCAAGVYAAPCGSAPGDASMMASLTEAIAAQCGCCGQPGADARCVLRAIKPMRRAGRLSRMCARKLLRNAIGACPLAGGDADCRACSTDTDCGLGEFCDCRAGSCGKTGGVCTQRTEICPQIVAPVCGCDGKTYANDCERQAAGACKRRDGTCLEAGGCFDTMAHSCTQEACSPEEPCQRPNQFCTPRCAVPPPSGTCFDLRNRTCTARGCAAGADCLPDEACLPACPPPAAGKCFITVDGQCSDEACDADHPCRQPNEFCNPACLAPPDSCASDADCDDGNGCSADHCADGTCQHTCICVGPAGATSCCPGPAALCVKPCSADPAAGCGACPPGASCMDIPGADACRCVSPLGGPCGGTIFVATVCAPGLICEHSHADATGVCVDPTRPCAGADPCGGACTAVCADGSTVDGTCAPGVETNQACACTAQCSPEPTPTVGPCGGVDACGGACPLTCPDGSTGTGQCIVVVVDPPPPGKLGEPVGPTCLCLGGCSTPPPTPTPGPCGGVDACGGTCPLTCPDGSTGTGQCLVVVVDPPPPGKPGEPVGPTCRCLGDCSPPPPTPTRGPCGDTPQCAASCQLTCPDGSVVTGQCVPPPADPAFKRPCACIASCGSPPTPTPGACDQDANCAGPCPFTCPDGKTTVGHCLGSAVHDGKPGRRVCGCVASCAPPPTIPVPPLPHGTICCECGEGANRCFEKHWVEVTPACPDGCTTVVNGTCDPMGSCVAPHACTVAADCDDGNGCTFDRCVAGACAHDCVCLDAGGSCHPGPLARPNLTRH